MRLPRHLTLCAVAALLAAQAPLRALSAGADFLRMEAPARPAALGGAFVGFTEDASAFQWDCGQRRCLRTHEQYFLYVHSPRQQPPGE